MADVNLDTTLLNGFSPFPYHFMFNIFFRTSSDLSSFLVKMNTGWLAFPASTVFPHSKSSQPSFLAVAFFNAIAHMPFHAWKVSKKGVM